MIEVRFHGRGGQGAKLASRILGQSGFLSGLFAQDFALFGAERRGAPVVSFTRLSAEPIDRRGNAGHQQGRHRRPGQRKKDGAPRFVIENLYIRNAKVEIGSNLSDKTMSAPLLGIHLANIGKQKPGATPGGVTENIIDALGKSVITTVANVDTSAVLGEARKEYAVARGKFEETGKTAVGGLKELFGK